MLAGAGTVSLAVLAVIAVGAMVLAVLSGQLTRRVPNSDGGLYAYARYEAGPLIEATIAEAAAGGQGAAATYAHWAAAILNNGLGRYQEALAAAKYASQETPALYMSMWALPELVEAAVRCGNSQLAAEALERLADTARPGGTDFGLGIEARSRALVSEGAAADELYREAIGRLGRTRLRPELARADLLYGEWLRRAGRAGRAVKPGDQHPAVPQPAHRRVAPAQGLRQARHQLAQAAPRGPE